VRQDRNATLFPHTFKHFPCRTLAAEKAVKPPCKNVDAVLSVAILHAGYQHGIAGTGFKAGFPKSVKSSLVPTPVVFGYEEHTVAP
jgi:hypothetical protein